MLSPPRGPQAKGVNANLPSVAPANAPKDGKLLKGTTSQGNEGKLLQSVAPANAPSKEQLPKVMKAKAPRCSSSKCPKERLLKGTTSKGNEGRGSKV